jgi:hypothetical protein
LRRQSANLELDISMHTSIAFVTSLALSAVALNGSAATAQSARGSLAAQREREQLPCASAPAAIDSAQVEAIAVLFSNSPLLAELRQQQSIPEAKQLEVAAVRDGSVCRQLASNFGHSVSPNTRVAVLRLGPIFYARDPDRQRGTGFFADSTLHVLVRLGAPIDK